MARRLAIERTAAYRHSLKRLPGPGFGCGKNINCTARATVWEIVIVMRAITTPVVTSLILAGLAGCGGGGENLPGVATGESKPSTAAGASVPTGSTDVAESSVQTKLHFSWWWTPQTPAPAPAPVAAPAPAPAAAPVPVPAPAPVAAPAPLGEPKSPTVPTGRVIQVGPTRSVTTLAQASATAIDGDTVEIDSGVYYGDVASWRQNNLTIRGVGGRPVLDAGGASAQGKGIFVISGGNVTVENLEFINARVPDRNGAGIRMEGAHLTVRNAVFRGNETSIMTIHRADAVLEVFDSEFIGNGFASAGGQMHGIYVNQIGRFLVQGSYFSRTEIGHLIKSRARENHILYNRITDDSQSAVSYEVDLPNGGIVYLIGNLIEQSARTDNPQVVGYGEEGLPWGVNQLYAVNNTFVNRRSGSCNWIWAPQGGAVRATNNLLLGNCGFSLSAGGDLSNNRVVTDADFVDTSVYDFRLRSGSAAWVAELDPGSVNGQSLRPNLQHRFPTGTTPVESLPLRPGAFQTPQ